MSLWEHNSSSLIHTTPPTDIATATENVIIKISLVSKKKKKKKVRDNKIIIINEI